MKTEPSLGVTYLIREKFWSDEIAERRVIRVSSKYVELECLNGHKYWVSKENWYSFKILDIL